MNIYERAKINGVSFEFTCVGISMYKWDMLMKNHKRADRKKVVKIALMAGVIDEEQAREEIKRPYYNPYNHFKTDSHIIYVQSAIEHFIKVF